MLPRRRTPLLATLLALSACSSDADSGSDGGPLHEIPDDAVQVVASSESLTLVRDLEIAGDGTIWVLDEHPPYFVGFDPEGEVVAEFGVRGDGPLEFSHPVSLVVTTGETAGVWSYDRIRHAFIRLAAPNGASNQPEGTSIPLPRDVVSPGGFLYGTGGVPSMHPWMDASGGSVFAAHPAGAGSRGSSFWSARVVEIPLETGTPVERWDMADYLPDPAGLYPGANEFLPIPLWATCPGGEGWMYDPAAHQLRSLDTDRTHDLHPARTVAFTTERLIDMILPMIQAEVPSSERPPDDELREMLTLEVEQMSDEFAQVFPEYFQLLCAPDGTLWLQQYHWSEGHEGAGHLWERIPPDHTGDLPERVLFPDGFQPFRIILDRAWGIVRDDFDVPAVAWVPLP
jgi:hypothetical protein